MTNSGSIHPADATSEYSPSPRQPRLWPGVLIVVLQWLLIKIPAYAAPQTMIQFRAMMLGPLLGLLAILVWWLAFSRLPKSLRWLGLVPLLLFPILTIIVAHPSIRMGIVVAGLPLTNTAFVLCAVAGAYLGDRVLRGAILVGPLIVFALFAMLRMDGLDGSIHFTTSWRWRPTEEERFLAKISQDPSLAGRRAAGSPTTTPADLALAPGDWPAFRGPARDGKVVGVSINADWANHPPRPLWKHLIGPGWSSFCVVGDHAFTQEQRGESELVTCYNLNTGDQLWSHEDHARFSESMAGPGPRATPTFADGKLYALGARGQLNCLNPLSGEKIWSRDLVADTGARVPDWGFSASPLAAHGVVAVITGAPGKAVAAYDALTGQPAWSAGDGYSYASLQLAHLGGTEQMLFVTADGITSLEPQGGKILWRHSFPLPGGANRAIQPTILNDNEFLLGAAFGIGTQRVKVTRDSNAWNTQTLWTSRKIKPYYNDMVFHKGSLYGFDGSVFTCIDPATGAPRWRAADAGYGNGQVLLLPDQDLLLILTETGEAALVDAAPDAHHERGRFPAISGKTWNHPVIAHGKLLVRNGEEVACYAVE